MGRHEKPRWRAPVAGIATFAVVLAGLVAPDFITDSNGSVPPRPPVAVVTVTVTPSAPFPRPSPSPTAHSRAPGSDGPDAAPGAVVAADRPSGPGTGEGSGGGAGEGPGGGQSPPGDGAGTGPDPDPPGSGAPPESRCGSGQLLTVRVPPLGGLLDCDAVIIGGAR